MELEHASDEERSAHFGHEEKLVTDKKIVYYSGTAFPFKDNEFDYVICSHVLEHVDDVPAFISEIFRVSGKGYFEYPLIYYEYLYNFNVHVNFVKYNGTAIYYKKKAESNLNEFAPVQHFFHESLNAGHVKIINDLLPLLMEGFEWDKPFKVIQAKDINDLVSKDYTMIPAPVIKESSPSAKHLIKQLLRKCF